MVKQFVCQLFSDRCQLKFLHLDISNGFPDRIIHKYLSLNSNNLPYENRSCCMTLRRLYIRLSETQVFESLIEHVPNLEYMSVEFDSSLNSYALSKLHIELLRQSNKNWFNKIPKLQCFCFKTLIYDDLEFVYLKWLLNNINYVKKLRLHLRNDKLKETRCQNIWKSLIDANFIRQYCLPDIIPNLIDFDFYICSQCQLPFNDIEKQTNSFKIHPFFLDHQWTNVKYLFDPIMSSQHIFSCFTNSSQFSNNLINYSRIFKCSSFDEPLFSLHPSLHLFLEQFNELSSHVSFINVYRILYKDFDETDLLMSLKMLYKMRRENNIDITFRNVTKIQYGTHFDRQNAHQATISKKQSKLRGKVLANLISMTVQLKYLLVERFEWFLEVFQYASDELRTDALSTVRYVEFCLPSCHRGDESIHLGKHLVPLLSKYMPHLQTLRLWRPDDFPWTTIRPDYKKYSNGLLRYRWVKSLQTPQSIAQHVLVFEQDLCQLTEQLKEFTFLDIFGEIPSEKVEPYRVMIQSRFPHSLIVVEMLRFRLWL